MKFLKKFFLYVVFKQQNENVHKCIEPNKLYLFICLKYICNNNIF